MQAMATRERILKVAVPLISERGYDGITVQEICSQAETSRPNFYTYFSSKRDVAREVLQGVNDALYAELAGKEDETAFAFLLHYTDAYLRGIQGSGKAFIRETLKFVTIQEFSDADVGADRYKRMVVDILRRAKNRNELPADFDEELFNRDFQLLFYGLMIDWCIVPDADLIEYGKGLVTTFIIDRFRRGACREKQ